MTLRFALLTALVPGAAMAGDLPAAVTDDAYLPVRRAEAELGQLLFYDPVLSGNRNISCGTCHHPRFATGDGVSLSLGEGGTGLGPDRTPDPANMPEQRIPRNATALFNLGAREFTVMFHDGRVEADPSKPSGLRTPLDEDMVQGFSGVLSAQTMFPVLSADEMAGHYSENDVAQAVRQGRITGEGGAWDIIAGRVAAIPAYRQRFEAVYPGIETGEDIGFTDISNAVAAFIAFEWRSDDSAFDAHLRGEAALDGAAADGMDLFYGEAGCSACHSGRFQTDHGFHAMGVPQLGPGKAARFESHARDEGRIRVTGRAEDAYAFRTPSLRNVTRTGPWGHSGAYSDLRKFLAAHTDPKGALAAYDRGQAVLPDMPSLSDWQVMDDPAEVSAITEAAVPGRPLPEQRIDALIAFLTALEDQAAIDGRLGIPAAVPSGLPVDR
ncbi:cytochrome-c peroxidase [Anianabacter salinae]|uniref:cytochrome-c peroxidase n=1 Tax=Anianabacter salinae TaxID=2851023 RepID=UPI00225E6906|nr:cytochrome c peroxidase [Anianabacter salinae]MBV0912018.1 cytochrome-c peroxidase [Anianabacter salinae]